MARQQRFKYEMFVQVRDFGAAQAALFPELSKGGQALARVPLTVAVIDEHMKNHVLGGADFEYLKTIAKAARRVTRPEPGVSPFRLPRHRSPVGGARHRTGVHREGGDAAGRIRAVRPAADVHQRLPGAGERVRKGFV